MNLRGSPDILAHVERQIGPVFQIFEEIITDDLQIDILHVKSSLFRRYEVLITSGMSAKPMAVPNDSEESPFAEVLILLPRKWPLSTSDFGDESYYWPIRLLKDIARYVHHSNTWIGFGHTVAMAESSEELQPYAPSTALCACVMLPPLSLGEASWCLKRQGRHDVFFWSAVPIYKEELALKIDSGIDALMDQFDRLQISDRVDPERRNAALL